MKKLQSHYDIVILGAGIVGLTFANLLPDYLRIAVIEAKLPTEFKIEQDKFALRVSAINHASQQIFSAANVWPLITQQRISSFLGMEVWDNTGSGHLKFDCCEIAAPNIGHIIENFVMVKALRERLAMRNIDVICPAEPLAIAHNPEMIKLVLSDNKELSTKLLIGADGANSWLREQANIEIRSWPYYHQALVTTVRTELPHQQIARQVFFPEGVLAFLPLADPHYCSIVWSTTDELMMKLARAKDTDFNQMITATFMQRLGNVTKVDRSEVYPLTMRHAKHYVQPRIALIGDAAHTIHPLAGQGVNLGIADAACLAEIVKRMHEKKRDIGRYENLRPYERARKGPNLVMINAMESFKRLFAMNSGFVINARNQGLSFVNNNQWLKNFFMRRAVGEIKRNYKLFS